MPEEGDVVEIHAIIAPTETTVRIRSTESADWRTTVVPPETPPLDAIRDALHTESYRDWEPEPTYTGMSDAPGDLRATFLREAL